MRDLLEHDTNEKHIELEVMMTRIRGRCFSFFYFGTKKPGSVCALVVDILFEHPWFLVINKPTNLLTQAVDGIDSVQTELEKRLKERNQNGPNPFIGIPHRLDRVTTGVMIIARNQRALRRLSDQFASRKVKKTYHAIVPTSELLSRQSSVESSIRWVDFLRKIPDQALGEVCSPDTEGAREASLTVRLLRRCALPPHRESLCLCEVVLETGRMHQIRLQFASRGMPIIGDDLYGSKIPWILGNFRSSPIALHARSVTFHHPQTAELLRFEADYPKDWDRLEFQE
jgi:23S rRNA pseudouridine1911/1915/1917 synthase